MTTRSTSENPLDIKNRAPFSTIFMTYSPLSSTPSRSIAGTCSGTDSRLIRWMAERADAVSLGNVGRER